MRKSVKALLAVLVLVFALALSACSKGDGTIKVGVVNNPPSESGYREANVKDMEKVFSK